MELDREGYDDDDPLDSSVTKRRELVKSVLQFVLI